MLSKDDTNIIIGYKFLNDEMKSANGDAAWELNKWKEHAGTLELCRSGFHACRTPLQSLNYIYGNRWFVVEAGGEFLEETDDKFVCRRMRIIQELLPLKEIMLRFAVACAKRSLFRFEQQFPQDDRPRKAIEAAEACLLENIMIEGAELAGSAARSAESAARSATHSAVRSSAMSAELAALSAAVSAARSATTISIESATRSATMSMESAVWSAEVVSRSAAWLAELKWQEKKLQQIIFRVAGV